MTIHYIVEVYRWDNDEVVKRIDCGTSERKAERVELGVLHQTNLDIFNTRIVEEEKQWVKPE